MTEKNMGKKLLTLTLALSMTLALPPVGALAEEESEGQSTGAEVSNPVGAGAAEIATLPAKEQGAPAVFVENGKEEKTDNGRNEANGEDNVVKDENNNAAPKDEMNGNGAENTEHKEEGGDSHKNDADSVANSIATLEGEGNLAVTAAPKEEVTYVATIEGETDTYNSLKDAIKAAKDGDTIVLAKDWAENIQIDKSLTLDLNDKILSGDGKGTVVTIGGKDNNLEVTVQNGTVTDGGLVIDGKAKTYGGGFHIQNGKVTVQDCIIENNTALAGGGVYITGSANVKIIDCEVRDNNAKGSTGGAIYQASGWVIDGYYDNTCEIIDTKLEHNSASSGGAVGMGATLFHDGITNANGGKGVSSTFIMDGDSTINWNTASTRGGGVYLSGNGSRFLMKNGSISNNTAKNSEGGGIWATNYGGITIEDGIIRDNTAKTLGGAVYIKANISDSNKGAKLAVETGLEDCLNLGETIITGNKATQGGGIYIDSFDSSFGVKADLSQATIYDNHAEDRGDKKLIPMGDDIYSTGKGAPGCTIQLGDTSSDWELSCGDNDTVDGWYIDGKIGEETTPRWNAHPDKGELYAKEYTQRENLTGALALKAAHEQLYKVTVHYVYSDGTQAAEDAVISVKAGADYSIDSPAIEGYKADKTIVSGTIPADTPADAEITVTYTKESSGGGGGGHHPKPKPTVEILDEDALGLNNTDHYAYIVGYGNGDVRPQNSITRAEVAAIFFRLLEDDIRSANFTHQNDFSDVAADDWYCSSVSTLNKMGIVAGYPDGTFRPNAPITRAEFAAIATRFDNNGDKTPVDFNDIAGHWAEGEITIAANHGWVTGYGDSTFRPQNQITRAETMSLVNRVLNRIPETPADLLSDMITWTDNTDTEAWYYLPVQEATNSHYYEFKDNSKYEKWTELRETRDWSKLG